MNRCIQLMLALSSLSCSVSHAAAPPSGQQRAPAPAPAVRTAPAPSPGRVPEGVRPEAYATEKIVAVVRDYGISQGNFLLGVVPMTHRLTVASRYPSWVEKRRSPEEMASLIRQEKPAFRGSVFAALTVIYVGDLLSEGQRDLQLPDDLAEYVFLENDRGDAVRCTRAELPLMRLVNPLSTQVDVNLVFSDIEATHPDFFETKSLTFVIGGLGFRRNTITFPYPMEAMFDDAPDPLRELYARSDV